MTTATRQLLSKSKDRDSDGSTNRTHDRKTTRVRPLAAFVLLPLLVALSGCSTLSVSKGEGKDAKKLGGVPFYVKTNAYRQVTAYAETQWTVTVTLETLASANAEKGNPRTLVQLMLADSTYRGVKMEALRTAIMAGNAAGPVSETEFDRLLAAVINAASDLKGLGTINDCVTSESEANKEYCPMVLNRVVSEMIVDTSTIYYINGRRPFAGSAKSDFTLASDLTLTNAKAEQDDKTLEQILSVLPVKEFLSKDLGLETETKAEAEAETEKSSMESALRRMTDMDIGKVRRIVESGQPFYFRLVLSATPQVILYEATKATGKPEAAASLTPLTLANARSGAGGVQLERRIVDPTEPKDPKKEEDPGYRISGTILVPKTEAPANDK